MLGIILVLEIFLFANFAASNQSRMDLVWGILPYE